MSVAVRMQPALLERVDTKLEELRASRPGVTRADVVRELVVAGLDVNTRLLAKIGSVVVHADELTGPNGHAFDQTALRALLSDGEVAAWVASMGPLVPRKR